MGSERIEILTTPCFLFYFFRITLDVYIKTEIGKKATGKLARMKKAGRAPPMEPIRSPRKEGAGLKSNGLDPLPLTSPVDLNKVSFPCCPLH